MRLTKTSLILVPNPFTACLLIALIVLAAMIGMRLLQRRPDPDQRTKPSQSAASTIVHNAIGELRAQKKLVVLQASVTADIMKQSERRFLGISLGETRILLRAPGQIQFVVPLDRLDEKSITYDPAEKKLVLRVPRPIPDRDIVGVDPSRITVWRSVGWCRLSGSARQLEDEAKTEVTSELIAGADIEWLQQRADEEAREMLPRVLAPMCRRLDENVTIQTRFLGEAELP